MIYVVENELKNFGFWSGAVTVARDIDNLDNSCECWERLEEVLAMDNEYPTETEVNDFVWFYAWDILANEGLVTED